MSGVYTIQGGQWKLLSVTPPPSHEKKRQHRILQPIQLPHDKEWDAQIEEWKEDWQLPLQMARIRLFKEEKEMKQTEETNKVSLDALEQENETTIECNTTSSLEEVERMMSDSDSSDDSSSSLTSLSSDFIEHLIEKQFPRSVQIKENSQTCKTISIPAHESKKSGPTPILKSTRSNNTLKPSTKRVTFGPSPVKPPRIGILPRAPLRDITNLSNLTGVQYGAPKLYTSTLERRYTMKQWQQMTLLAQETPPRQTTTPWTTAAIQRTFSQRVPFVPAAPTAPRRLSLMPWSLEKQQQMNQK